MLVAINLWHPARTQENLLGLSCHLALCFAGSSPVTQLRVGSIASVLSDFGERRMGPECPALAECGFNNITGIFTAYKDDILCQAGICQMVTNVIPPL